MEERNNVAYLITISPPEVLGPDVLIRVLGPLGTRVDMLLVSLVLPMGIPPELRIEGREDEAGHGDTILVISEHPLKLRTHTTRSPPFQKPVIVTCEEERKRTTS